MQASGCALVGAIFGCVIGSVLTTMLTLGSEPGFLFTQHIIRAPHLLCCLPIGALVGGLVGAMIVNIAGLSLGAPTDDDRPADAQR